MLILATNAAIRFLRFTLNLASVSNYATNKQLANTFTLLTLLLFISFYLLFMV